MKELIIYPTKDATVNSDMPDDNFGEYYICFIGTFMKQCIYKSYLQFELPILSSNNEIKKVELNIYVMRNDNAEIKKEYKITRLSDSFEENLITYKNVQIATELEDVHFEIEDQLDQYIKIDITKLFSLSSNEKEFTVELKSHENNGDNLIAFYSKDCDEMKFYPYIRIIFSNEKPKTSFIETDNKTKMEYFKDGSEYFYLGKYDKALEYYIQLLRVFDREANISPTLLYRSCLCYIELGMYTHAYKLSNEAIKLYPNLSGMYYIKGLLYMKLYELLKAKDMFENCLELSKTSNDIYQKVGCSDYLAFYYLGEINYEEEYYKKAYKYYIEAVKLNPRYTKPYNKIVDILLINDKDLGFIEECILDLKQYKSKQNVQYDLVEILIKLKKYKEAYELLSRINDRSEKANYLKGQIFMRMKKYDKALDVFNSIKQEKYLKDIQFDIILCQIYLKNIERAKEILYKISFNYTDKSLIYRLLINSVFDRNTKITNKILQELQKKTYDIYDEIFSLIEKILLTAESDIFEKSLYIIDFLDNTDVLLKLGKIYYKHRLYHMALAEFVRSIKEFNHIDKEGLYMMKKCLIKLEKL